MRAVWKGSISFGLVNIPVALHNASRVEELKFRLLRSPDLSPVNYKRVAQLDGKEVPWDKIVKGYEYAKGKYIVLKDEDFRRVDLEATDTVNIVDFVALDQINPVYFYKPYYLEPLKGAQGAYSLLRAVLAETNKAGIAKIVIRTRQHLAAVKCNGDLLVLELMRFSDELVSPAEIKVEKQKVPATRELKVAKSLVDQMSEDWDPARYTDEYKSALMQLVEKKIAAGGKDLPATEKKGKAATNVIDLATVLEQSLAEISKGKKKSPTKTPPKRVRGKAA